MKEELEYYNIIFKEESEKRKFKNSSVTIIKNDMILFSATNYPFEIYSGIDYTQLNTIYTIDMYSGNNTIKSIIISLFNNFDNLKNKN